MNNVEKLVREELGKILNKDVSDIPIDADLVEEVGLDSLTVLEIFGMVEDKFGIVVDVSNISSMKTIKDIVDIIESDQSA